MGRGGQDPAKVTRSPLPDGKTMFARHESASVEEAQQILSEKGMSEWYLLGEYEDGVYVARDLGVPLHEVATELSRFGDDWMIAKNPEA